MEEPRQAIPDAEPPVTTNAETTPVSEEQPPRDAGVTTIADVAADHPVDTDDGKYPETEEEEQESEGSREGEPIQQGQTRVEEPEQ